MCTKYFLFQHRMSRHKANRSQLHILIVKTSSMGDVIHNLPVVSDIAHYYPSSHIEWLVEESFSPIPKMHPAVSSVIPVAIRRWRKSLLSRSTFYEWSILRAILRSRRYDYVIDTQGLLKSALLARLADGVKCGFDWTSSREPIASFLYQKTYHVPNNLHAVDRNRNLAALALGFRTTGYANFGIHTPIVPRPDWLEEGHYAVFLHSTSRTNKLWNESNWQELGLALLKMGLHVLLPWGSEPEFQRSQRLAAKIPNSICPPKLTLENMAALLGNASVAIGVDTGLAHLACALNVPTIGIYTATDPILTGLYPNSNIINLGGIEQAPSVSDVIAALDRIMPCR